MKTSELTGPALDWAVAKAIFIAGTARSLVKDEVKQYSTDWSQGGPIIEREKIGVIPSAEDANVWVASVYEPEWKFNRTGPTPLIAAMRCFVSAELGDEVETPYRSKE